MYSWEAPKESASADVLAHLNVAEFERRAAVELQDAETRLARATSASNRATAMASLADALHLRGDVRSAHSAATDAVALAEEIGEPHVLARARVSWATHAMHSGSLDEARRSTSIAISEAELADEPELLGIAQVQLATCELASRDTDAALRLLDTAFAIGRREGLTTLKGYALAAVGCSYVLEMTSRATLSIFSRAQLLHERVADVGALARTYNNLGALHYRESLFVNAIPYFERALDLLMGAGDLVTLLNTMNNAVRATEQYSLERAGRLRDKMEAFAETLDAPRQARLLDRTSLQIPTIPGPDNPRATFESDLVVEAPILLLPIPVPTQSTAPD